MINIAEALGAKLGAGWLGYALTAGVAMTVTAGSVVFVGQRATEIKIASLDLPFSFQPPNLAPATAQLYAAQRGSGRTALTTGASGQVIELTAIDTSNIKVAAVSAKIVAEAEQDNQNLQKIADTTASNSAFKSSSDAKLVFEPPKPPQGPGGGAGGLGGSPAPPPPPNASLPPIGNPGTLASPNPAPTSPASSPAPTSAPATPAPTLPPIQTVVLSPTSPPTQAPSPSASASASPAPSQSPSPPPATAVPPPTAVPPTAVPPTAAPQPTQVPPAATATPTSTPTPLPLNITPSGATTGLMILPSSLGRPGSSVVKSQQIKNTGSGAFTYALTITCTTGCANTLWTDTTNGLQLKVTRTGTTAPLYSGAIASAPTISVIDNSSNPVVLSAGGSDTITLEVDFPSTAGNSFQGQSLSFSYTWTATSYP